MISTSWLDKRQPYWTRLEALLDRIGRSGLDSLNRPELQELGLLYRQIASDLAVLREDRSSVHIATYLNGLLVRAHNSIYSAQRPTPAAAVRFFFNAYPAIFRRNIRYCVAAVLLFGASAAAAVALTVRDPDFKTRILGPDMVETIERREMWTHSVVAIKPLASSAIMTNNLSVSFAAFAAGITAGLGTIYLLAVNGLLIGTIGAACWSAGMSLQLWSFVAPHGVLELPAIFIAAGAGLRLAAGVLFPGLLPRRASIARAGTEAVQLLFGCVPILIIAGVIEAFVSPTTLTTAMKFALAAALFTLLNLYLFSKRAPAATAGSAA